MHAMTINIELLERVPFLRALSPGDRQALVPCFVHRQFRRGDIIFQKDEPGQSLFIIGTGSVRIYVPSSHGADLTLAVMGPGDFFGDLSLLDGGPRSASAVALSDTAAYALERSDFVSLMRSRPEAALAVLEVVAQRLRETDQRASDLAFLEVRGRLARKLLELADRHGIAFDDGVLIDAAITQEDLASMIGVTRESVNRNLSLFRRQGLIGNRGRKLVIRRSADLRAYCD